MIIKWFYLINKCWYERHHSTLLHSVLSRVLICESNEYKCCYLICNSPFFIQSCNIEIIILSKLIRTPRLNLLPSSRSCTKVMNNLLSIASSRVIIDDCTLFLINNDVGIFAIKSPNAYLINIMIIIFCLSPGPHHIKNILFAFHPSNEINFMKNLHIPSLENTFSCTSNTSFTTSKLKSSFINGILIDKVI